MVFENHVLNLINMKWVRLKKTTKYFFVCIQLDGKRKKKKTSFNVMVGGWVKKYIISTVAGEYT